MDWFARMMTSKVEISGYIIFLSVLLIIFDIIREHFNHRANEKRFDAMYHFLNLSLFNHEDALSLIESERSDDPFATQEELIAKVVYHIQNNHYKKILDVNDEIQSHSSTPCRQDKSESPAMRHLLHMLMHDRDAAERLIAYEAEKNPSASREENIHSAIERIQRDNK